MVMCCEKEFPKGSFPYQKKDGFFIEPLLKMQIDYYLKNVGKDWDFVIIISGEGEVRTGKSLLPNSSIKIKENGKIVDKKLSEFNDGDLINTLSWDFKNKKQIESVSEVIVEKDDKDFFEVELENGKKVFCTKEHKLFVKRKFQGTNNKTEERIIELKLKDIKEGDEIVCLN